jgi:hypothetical protein
MAASVLKSDQAIAMSLSVVRAFVKMREALAETKQLQLKLTDLEQKLTSRQNVQEKAILAIIAQIRKLSDQLPTQLTKQNQIGFRKTQKK